MSSLSHDEYLCVSSRQNGGFVMQSSVKTSEEEKAMADTKKSKEMIQRLNELDRISELPEALISQILSHLPTKKSVSTSVLTTRWRNLWLWVPHVRLDSRKFPSLDAFVSFGDRFFSSDGVSCIEKVELIADRDESDYVTPWVDSAVKRKLQHLELQYCSEMPLSVYTCKTLVSLSLHEVSMVNSEFVCLPRLKTMRLNVVLNPDDATFERLVSSCPVLEELEISDFLNDGAKRFRVISRSLKKLSMQLGGTGSKAVIDAPRLGFLKVDGTLEDSFTVTDMDSECKLVLSICSIWNFDESSLLSDRNIFSRFLSGVSNVKDLTIFGNISTGYLYKIWLPAILESFPNLKSLSWECDAEYEELHFEEMKEISFAYVPECLHSSLELIDFKVPFSGLAGEMKVVRYFLENSALLKKLTLHCRRDCSTKSKFKKKLLRIPRASTICEVVIL